MRIWKLSFFFSMLFCAINAQDVTLLIEEINVLKQKQDIESCLALRKKSLNKTRSEGDSLKAALTLIATNDCLFADKQYDSFKQIAVYALSNIDSTLHYEVYRSGLKQLLNYSTYFDNSKISFYLHRMVDLDSIFSYDKHYKESLRSLCQHYQIAEEFEKSIHYSKELLGHDFDVTTNLSAYTTMANSYRFTNVLKSDSCFRNALALDITQADSVNVSALFRDYSNFLVARGKAEEAITYNIKCLDFLPEKPMIDLSRASTLVILSQLFIGIDQLDRAREYINKAIEVAEKRGYKMRNGLMASVNAQIYEQEGEINKAKNEFDNAIIYFKGRKFHKRMLSNYALKGQLFLMRNQLDSSGVILQQIYDEIESLEIEAKNEYVLDFESEYFLRIGQSKNAKRSYSDLLNLTKRIDKPKGILKAYKGLSKIAVLEKRYKAAYNYQNEYHYLNDSIYQADQDAQVLRLESSFKRKEQDTKIALLDKETEVQSLMLSRQKMYLIGGAFGLLFLVLVASLLYKLFTRVRSQNLIIKQSLDEKDILLKEIHHRVKNNLQLVSSLLTLQSREIKDEKAIAAINAGKSRVRSMALIHQDLYSKDNLTGINLKKYLENLCQELFATYNIDRENVKLNLDIEDIYLDVDTIIPLGLIINELITNSLKYAFVQNEPGWLKIKLNIVNDKLVLDVKDNGIGFEDDELVRSKSFGTKLIHTLSEQLEGKLTMNGTNGAHVNIEFNDFKIAS